MDQLTIRIHASIQSVEDVLEEAKADLLRARGYMIERQTMGEVRECDMEEYRDVVARIRGSVRRIDTYLKMFAKLGEESAKFLHEGKYFDPTDIVEDGFGNAVSAYCPECGEKSMVVVRPGKFQCNNCG